MVRKLDKKTSKFVTAREKNKAKLQETLNNLTARGNLSEEIWTAAIAALEAIVKIHEMEDGEGEAEEEVEEGEEEAMITEVGSQM